VEQRSLVVRVEGRHAEDGRVVLQEPGHDGGDHVLGLIQVRRPARRDLLMHGAQHVHELPVDGAVLLAPQVALLVFGDLVGVTQCAHDDGGDAARGELLVHPEAR
jgi:hypothetical protein